MNENEFWPPDAPVFYPTCDEFADPLEYLEKIRPIGSRAGLCKIIPPKVERNNISFDSFENLSFVIYFLLQSRNGNHRFA